MEILVKDLEKSYNQVKLFHLPHMEFHSGRIYCLMGASGSGKTTLMRILMGLETPDAGSVELTDGQRFSAVFQEDRLCETFSPLENVRMVLRDIHDKQLILDELEKILPRECLKRPVSTLSGGMKRRVAICRAMMSPSDAVIMDEPFTGLDSDTKLQVIRYIKDSLNGRMLLVSTHQPEDSELLDGQAMQLTDFIEI